MDTIDWRELDLDERWAKMDFAIGTLSMLHSAMLFHGDAEFKNIAFGEMGEIVVVDPELMVSSIDLAYICSGDFPPDEQQRAALRIKQSMSKDFTDLTNSVQAQLFKGLPERQRPGSEAALFKEMKRNVYNSYRAAIYSGDSPFKDVLLRAFEVMLHERKEQSRLN